MYRDIKSVYDSLCDAESKLIFKQMAAYSLSWNWEDFQQILDYYCKPSFGGFKTILNLIKEPALACGREVIAFGTGEWASHLLGFFANRGINVDCFVDNDPLKVGGNFLGKPIFSVQELGDKHYDALIVIASEKYEEEMIDQLLDMGIEKGRIIRFSYTDKEIYFDADIMQPGENEVFVDAGCFDGADSLHFVKWAKNSAKKIYAFEPDAMNYDVSKSCLEKVCEVEFNIFNKGLHSSTTTLTFENNASGGSRFSEQGTSQVEVVSLDDMDEIDEAITFIKMDIEGAELSALEGCKDIIKRDKPKLAICLYHKPEDIWEIPAYVHELVPEYKLYIRHYSPGVLDTVLYAVP